MIQLNGQTAPEPVSIDIEQEMGGGAREYNMLGQTVMDGYGLKKRFSILWKGLSAQEVGALDALLPDMAFVQVALDGGEAAFCYVETRALSRRPGATEYKAVLAER